METAGAGDRERWLLETLVGMRGTVALGSRLRGNDEGATRGQRGNDEGVAGTTRGSRERRGGRGNDEGATRGSRERRGGDEGAAGERRGAWKRRERATGRGGCWRPWLVCEGWLRWVPAFEGATRGQRGNDGGGGAAGERRMGAGRPGEVAVGHLGWYARDGCAGFPPSRERRGVAGTTRGSRERPGGRGNDQGATRGQRGNDEWERATGSGRPGEVAVGHLGWYARDGCAGFPPSRERRGGRGNDEGATRGQRGNNEWERSPARGGCWRPWLVCEGRLRWVPAFAGTTRGDEGAAGERRMGAGDWERATGRGGCRKQAGGAPG